MEPESPENSKDPDSRAAWWVARMLSGEATEAEQRACMSWRRAAPENDRQYCNMMYFWDASLKAPQEQLRAILKRDDASQRKPMIRRRLVLGAGAACAAAVVAGVALPQWGGMAPAYEQDVETERGERRQVTLPDGSVLYINTATRAKVRLYAGKRAVQLLAGEIMFTVAPDPSRPFVIDAGLGQVVVTGTRFDVRRDSDRLRVAVESGSVEVSAGPWWNRKTETLTAGNGAGVDPEGDLVRIATMDIAAATAWRKGRIVFDNMPLAQAVAEMNRYLQHPLRLQGVGLGQLRIAGVFGIDDPEAMLEALPKIAPVVVYRQRNGGAVIAAR